MDDVDPYGAVQAVLSEIAERGQVPAGARGRLFAAYDRLRELGDNRRAEICGSASVALLKQEQARRADDPAKAIFQDEVLRSLFDIWQSILTEEVEQLSAGNEVAQAA